MIINIYGSTGIIGRKTLDVIDRHFPDIKINLLCVKSNINLLRNQIKKYNPKYVFVYDEKKSSKLNLKKNKTKLLNYEQLLDYLNSTKSNLSVLAVSGYKSLYFLDHAGEFRQLNRHLIGPAWPGIVEANQLGFSNGTLAVEGGLGQLIRHGARRKKAVSQELPER